MLLQFAGAFLFIIPSKTKHMKFNKLVPNVFYIDAKVGLKTFVDCLGFKIGYDDLQSKEQPFCTLERDNLCLHLIQSKEFAEKDRPEFRLETDNIEEVYKQVHEKFPELLHPNLKKVTERAWGAKEFAVLDTSGVCIVIQQWKK